MNVHCNVGITFLFLFIIYILFIYPACVRFFFFDSICFLSSEFIHVNWHMVMKNIYCSSSKTVKSEEKKNLFLVSLTSFERLRWGSALNF